MADFVSPSGPPPPKVPEGYKAQWNEQYKEWYDFRPIPLLQPASTTILTQNDHHPDTALIGSM